MDNQTFRPGDGPRYPANLRGLKMDAHQESNTDAKPIASASVTFIATVDGGRKTMPHLNTEPYYRPHIVVQGSTIRHAAYDDAGMGNEQYMGVEFADGP